MAFSNRSADAGYATPAALVLSLGLALVGSAVAARGMQMLSHTKADLEKTRAEAALDGAHLSAAAAVVRSGLAGPFSWTFSTDVGWVRAVAEPEGEKLGLEAAASLDDASFQALGVADTIALRTRLADASSDENAVDVAALDTAPLWRDCAAGAISQFGTAEALAYKRHVEPTTGERPAVWRIGETWRIRLTTSAGWRDDRIVRFTGDARRPVAIVKRVLSRGKGDGAQCEELLAGIAGA